MKKILLIFISCLLLCCNSDYKQKELELKEKEIALKEREIALKEVHNKIINSQEILVDDSSNTIEEKKDDKKREKQIYIPTKQSFVYISLKVLEPRIKIIPAKYDQFRDLNGGTGPTSYTPSKTEIIMDENYYYTDVKKFENFNEDKEFELIDELEKRLKNKNYMLLNNISTYDWTTKQKNALENGEYKVRILKSQAFSYNSYKDASVSRKKLGE